MTPSDLDVFSNMGFPKTAERIKAEVKQLREFREKTLWRLKDWQHLPSTANGFKLLDLIDEAKEDRA